MGHVGSDADLGGPLQCGQHFQLAQAGVHIFGEPPSGAAAGVPLADGHGHHEVLLPVRAGAVCVQQWSQSAAVVSKIRFSLDSF